jgi:hypothetical protein
MLFDLRGRGRRRTVQGVYLGLALLMGGGLVLFGVGAGTGGGGLLNAFSGNGSGSNQTQVVGQQEQAALKAVKLDPSSPQAWSSLVQARWTAANQAGSTTTTGVVFTTTGKKELTGTVQAWQRYLQLTKTPDSTVTELAARAYGYLGNYAGEAGAWELEAAATPTAAKPYECLAVSAYAAKQTRKGDLAMAKALSFVPKASRVTLKAQIQAAKTQPAIAQSC